MKALNRIRKEKKSYAEVAKIHSEKEIFICEVVMKEKELVLGLLPHLQVYERVTATVMLRWKRGCTRTRRHSERDREATCT